jgi:hypothetical protein
MRALSWILVAAFGLCSIAASAMSPAEFKAFMKAEMGDATRVLHAAGVKPQ